MVTFEAAEGCGTSMDLLGDHVIWPEYVPVIDNNAFRFSASRAVGKVVARCRLISAKWAGLGTVPYAFVWYLDHFHANSLSPILSGLLCPCSGQIATMATPSFLSQYAFTLA
jgi:hypothetical protein